MVPAAIVDSILDKPCRCSAKTTPSSWRQLALSDDIARAKWLQPVGVHYVDMTAAASGLERGFS
jgi:hypothetical protein